VGVGVARRAGGALGDGVARGDGVFGAVPSACGEGVAGGAAWARGAGVGRGTVRGDGVARETPTTGVCRSTPATPALGTSITSEHAGHRMRFPTSLIGIARGLLQAAQRILMLLSLEASGATSRLRSCLRAIVRYSGLQRG
jgi:hypothetical protein